MVGHGGRSEGREYFIGADEGSEYVSNVFEEAKYFSGEDGEYRAAGIILDVKDEGIEYDVTQEVDDEIVQEFVEGIIKNFEGAHSEFRKNVKEEIGQKSRIAYTDGGETMADVDHGSSKDIQNVMERGPNKEEKKKVADGGFTDIPIGGAPNYVEAETDEETESMGMFPM